MIRILFCVMALFISTGAQAHNLHHKHTHYASYNSGGRPSAWCGWQMRQWLGGGPELNLARNWAHVGQPSGPQVGAVVVWPHHVGLIVGRSGSEWVVKSGNDGHQVRERPRSVAGAIAFRIVGHV
jgi:hypothetical protein